MCPTDLPAPHYAREEIQWRAVRWGHVHAWQQGSEDSSVVIAWWSKGRRFESLQEGWKNFLLQGQLSVLTLISMSVPPRVTAVVHKRPRISFCQKCRWQVTAAKYARTYVCHFAWSDMVHGCMVYTEHTETAAVSCGTSHASAVSTPLQWTLKTAL